MVYMIMRTVASKSSHETVPSTLRLYQNQKEIDAKNNFYVKGSAIMIINDFETKRKYESVQYALVSFPNSAYTPTSMNQIQFRLPCYQKGYLI